MESFLRILLLVCLTAYVTGSPCPSDWVQRGNSCYLVNTTSTLSWAGASALCQERGGSLASTQGHNQLVNLQDLVRAKSVTEWWVGVKEGNTSFDTSHIGDDKVTAQPDAYSSAQTARRYRCAYLSSLDGMLYWLEDVTALHYICQRPVELVDVQPVLPDRRRPSREWLATYGAGIEDEFYTQEVNAAQQDDKGVFSDAKVTMTPLPPPNTTVATTTSTAGTTLRTSTTAAPSQQCQGTNWLLLQGTCYQLVLDARNFTMASRACVRLGGQLGDFDNRAKRLSFLSQFGHNSGSIWVGLSSGLCRTLSLHTGDMTFASSCSAYKPFACERTPDATAMPSTVPPLTSPTTPSACGEGGWWSYGSSCYLLVTTPPAISWHAASRACAERGAHLAVLTSSTEVHNVFHQVTQSNLPVWIGLSKLSPPRRQFVWEDGESPGPQVDLFMADTDQSSLATDMSSCVRMDNEQPHWHAVNCNSPQYYVCERPIDGSRVVPTPTLPPAAEASVCPAGWERYGTDSCLQLSDRMDTWAAARQACISNGADLITINGPVQQALVTSAVRDTLVSLWMGLTYVRVDHHFLTWVDEAPVNFTNWARGQPSNNNCDQCPDSCGLVGGGRDHSPGAWSDVDCNQSFKYICQRPAAPASTVGGQQTQPPPPCPPPYQDFTAAGDACVKVVRAPANWSLAAATCRNSQSSLAYASSVFDNADLVRLLYPEGGDQYWLALSDIGHYGRMQWSAPWPAEPTYSNWKPEGPATTTRTSCAALAPSTGGLWRHLDCGQPLPFVCMHAPRREKAASWERRCPSRQWSASETRCYRLQDSERHSRTWQEAKQACEQQGQKLAVVSSESDFLAVQEAIRGLSFSHTAWIGLKQNDNGGFSWVDGSPVTFSGWMDGEPSASLESCVEASRLSAGRWNDVLCSMYRPFVCMVDMAANGTSGPQSPGVSASRQAPSGGVSGWGVLGLVLLCLALFAGVVAGGLWLRRRYPGGPRRQLLSSGRRPAHHSVENIAYSPGGQASESGAESRNDNFEAGASAMWGEGNKYQEEHLL